MEKIYKYYSLLKIQKYDLQIIKKNEELKNKYKGKRCFILGNAPTIDDIDITLLENEHVFVMSTFYNHPDYCKLKNTLFTTVQLTVANEDEEFNWLKTMHDNTETTDTFFFNIAQKNMIEKNNFFHDKSVSYIATANLPRSYDLSRPTREHETNVIQALEIAIYMGFDEIFMHSVNLNMICTSGKYEYFFDRKLLPHPDIMVNANNMCNDFFDEIQGTAMLANAINVVKQYADKLGIKIFYTNPESLLKFFDFIPFSESIKQSH